jgi:hypothetical protein
MPMPERVWKHRFAQPLSARFRAQGTSLDHALEDAYAHADECYLTRGERTPEQEAEAFYRSLSKR